MCVGTCLCLEVGGKLLKAGFLLPPHNPRNYTQAKGCCAGPSAIYLSIFDVLWSGVWGEKRTGTEPRGLTGAKQVLDH